MYATMAPMMRADKVHLRKLLLPARLGGLGGSWSLEKEDDDGDGNSTDRQVDIEAPAPSDVMGKGASDQGAENGGDASHCAAAAFPSRPRCPRLNRPSSGSRSCNRLVLRCRGVDGW